MKVLVLMGSPRLQGNTAELCKPFLEELAAQGADARYVGNGFTLSGIANSAPGGIEIPGTEMILVGISFS